MTEITGKTLNESLKKRIAGTLQETNNALIEFGYTPTKVSVQEFYDYMTGEIFSEDQTTIYDVLDCLHLMIHEVVEINELKKQGKKIDKRVIMDSPRELIYIVHFTAMEFELDYLKNQGETEILNKRLHAHYKVLTTDPNLPDSMKPKAYEIWEKHR